jgi:hypothetical protein
MITAAIFYRTLKRMRPDLRFEAIKETFKNAAIVKRDILYPCDLAVIQGWNKNNGYSSPHNAFREKIIDHQFKQNKHVLTVDGNIFNYKSKNVFFRYSIDGIFANTGYYFDDKIDPKRWQHIREVTGCNLKPWRKNGEHVLVLLQKDSGWTMNDVTNVKIIQKTISDVRAHTDRKIIIRVHPSDINKIEKYSRVANELGAEVSKNANITEDLKNAWCSMTYNSSPGAVSVIEGIPIFIMDSNWKRSPAAEVGNINIRDIENPSMFDRQPWIEKISMSHFSVRDIKDGLLWHRTLQYFERLGKI